MPPTRRHRVSLYTPYPPARRGVISPATAQFNLVDYCSESNQLFRWRWQLCATDKKICAGEERKVHRKIIFNAAVDE